MRMLQQTPPTTTPMPPENSRVNRVVPKAKLRRSRLLLACVAIIYPTWWFIYHHCDQKAYDSLAGRCLVGLIALLGIGLTYTHVFFQRQSGNIVTATGWLVTIHYFYLLYLNQMAFMFTFGGLIVVSAITACLSTPFSVASYGLLVLMASTIVTTVHTKFPMLIFSSGMGTVIIVGYVTALIRRGLFNQIKKSTTDLENLLNNLGQGFLVLNENLIIQPGSTLATAGFFRMDPTGKFFGEVLHLDENGQLALKKWANHCFSQDLSFLDLVPLAPAYFKSPDGRHIRLDYRPIYGWHTIKNRKREKRLDQIICISSDVTEEKKLKQQVDDEATMIKVLIQVAKDRQTFVEFVQETRLLLETFGAEFQNSYYEMDFKLMMRILHSIKGNTALFEMKSLAEIAHRLETIVSELKDAPADVIEGLD